MIILKEAQSGTTYVKANDVHRNLMSNGIIITGKVIQKMLEKLANNGYVIEHKTNSREVVYEASNFYDDWLMNIDWNQIVDYAAETMKKNYPEHANEYIRRYCSGEKGGEPLTTLHPFTGQTINVREHKDSILVSKSKDTLDYYSTQTMNEEDIINFIREKGEVNVQTIINIIGESREGEINKMIEQGELFKPKPDTLKVLE